MCTDYCNVHVYIVVADIKSTIVSYKVYPTSTKCHPSTPSKDPPIVHYSTLYSTTVISRAAGS